MLFFVIMGCVSANDLSTLGENTTVPNIIIVGDAPEVPDVPDIPDIRIFQLILIIRTLMIKMILIQLI